jgi:1-acyl-sn-glycerol-3-phosphate acyltransferase
MRALYRMIRALKAGTMVLFPEGTRTRSGRIRRGRPGAGLVILANRPKVVPVTIEGMNDVLPVGASWPRPFQRVTIVYGPPLDLSEFLGKERSKDTAQAIVNRVIGVLRYQREWILRYRAGEVGRDEPPWEEPGWHAAARGDVPGDDRAEATEAQDEQDRSRI